MNNFTDLEALYRYITVTHGFTGFVGKFTLCLLLYFLHTGNQRPGRRILNGVLAWHFAMAIAFLGGLGGTSLALRAACLCALVPLVLALVRNDVPWRILPEGSGASSAALVAYAVAMIFPFWSGRSLLGSVLFSPLGALPHQSLLVLTILLVVTGQRAGWPLICGTFAAAFLLGSIDIINGGRISGWLLWGATAVLTARFFLPLALGEMIGQPADQPPATKVIEGSVKSPPDNSQTMKEPAGSDRKKWDLR